MRDAVAGPRPLVLALVVSLSLGWGLSWPAMKIALTEFPVWTFRAASCLLAGLCLLALARLAYGDVMPRRAEWRWLAAAGLFNVTGWHMLIGYGVPLVPAGHAAVLAYTMPLWVVVLGTGLLGQPLELSSAIGLALGLGGIVTLVLPDLGTISQAPIGAGLVLLGALAWAIGTQIQKHLNTRLSMLAIAGWQLLLGCVPIIAMAPVVEGLHLPEVTGRAWLAAIYLTLVGLVFCYVAWFRLVSLMPASRASISTLLIPALGVVSSALVLGEPLGLRELLALTLNAGALALVLAPAMLRDPKIG